MFAESSLEISVQLGESSRKTSLQLAERSIETALQLAERSLRIGLLGRFFALLLHSYLNTIAQSH